MKLQTELCQPFPKLSQEPLSIGFALKPHYQIIRVADNNHLSAPHFLTPGFHPEVENVVQVHVRHPTTPEQRMLVDTLVDSEWLLRRFRRVESQLWQQGFPNATSGIFDVNLAIAFRKTCDEFSRLQRRIDMTQRHYRNALQDLERLQAIEAEEIAEEIALTPDSDPDPTPVTPPAETTKSENGFVPQLTPADPSSPPPDGLLR